MGFGAEGVKTITTLYDERQQSSEGLFHDESGALVLRVLLTRDSNGHVVKVESRHGDELPSSIARMIEQMPAKERGSSAAVLAQLFGSQSVMSSTSYQYDDRGRRIRCDVSMHGMSQQSTAWEYDERDNPILVITEDNRCDLQPDESGKLQPANQKSFRQEVRQDYKYDASGNWTERVVTARYEANPEFQLSNIKRREFVYYDAP
jgi:hypothetical protein